MFGHWLGAVIILMTLSAFGIRVYYQARVKVQFYQGVVAFCQYLQPQISFARTPLPELLRRYPLSASTSWQQVLNGYQQLLQGQQAVTREQCERLTADQDLAEFFYQLGRLGSAEEQVKLTQAEQLFRAKQAQAHEHLQHRASITCKLLIIMGIAGAIIWI